MDDLETLRRFVDDLDNDPPEFDDDTLNAILEARDGDIQAAASDVWAMKAAQYARLVNMSENNSTRSLSDMHKHALAMVKDFREASAATVVVLSEVTRTHRIVRE